MSYWALLNFLNLKNICLSPDFGSLQLLFLQIFSLYQSFFFSFQISGNTNARSFAVCSHTSLWGSVHFFFQPFFYLFCRIDNFYWLAFKFTDSCFFYHHFDVEPQSTEFLILDFVFSIPKFPFFLWFLFLYWELLFSLTVVFNFILEHSYNNRYTGFVW